MRLSSWPNSYRWVGANRATAVAVLVLRCSECSSFRCGSGAASVGPLTWAQLLDTRVSEWSVGVGLGVGTRWLPAQAIPGTRAPRLRLAAVEIRHRWPAWAQFYVNPDRLDIQIDWMHRLMTELGSRSPRLPISVYGTWLRPARARWDVSLSTGVYIEWGPDTLVIDEQLHTLPAGTVAWASRVALEHPRYWKKSATLSTGLAFSVGPSFGVDPVHPIFSRHIRVGIERVWAWSVGDGRVR